MKRFSIVKPRLGAESVITATWSCCDKFRDAEGREMIVATNHGWAAVGVGENVAFDVCFCPFCGTRLPEIR